MIQDEAIKCKHCHEFLTSPPPQATAQGQSVQPQTPGQPVPTVDAKLPWYFRKGFLIFMVLSTGPFALPLIWFRPKTSIFLKVNLTIVILVLSWFLIQLTASSLRNIRDLYLLFQGM